MGLYCKLLGLLEVLIGYLLFHLTYRSFNKVFFTNSLPFFNLEVSICPMIAFAILWSGKHDSDTH